MVKIAPSILSADFSRLGEQVREVEASGVDRVQIDVMDGRFVPNLSFGALAVRALRPLTPLTLEVHLMVMPPEDFIDPFAEAGADTLIVHQEATPHLHRAVQQIHARGKKAGVALNPATPAAMLSDILGDVELALLMTVNPGFGGQDFIAPVLDKIRQVRDVITRRRFDCEVEVDGGINEQTAPLAVEAGANVLVVGSAVYGARDGAAAAIRRLLASAESVRSPL